MRKLSNYLSLFLLATFFMISSMSAQEIAVSNGYYFTDDRMMPSVEAIFPESAEKVQAAFEDFAEPSYGVNLKSADLGKQGKYLYAEDVIMPALENRKIDIFIGFNDRKDADGSIMHFAVRQEDNDYVDRWYDRDTYNDMRNMVLGFIHYRYPEYYKEEMSAHQEVLADLNSNTVMIESEIEETRSEIDKRYDQIRVLSRKLVDMRKQMMSLEMQMKDELNKLENDQTIYLNIK